MAGAIAGSLTFQFKADVENVKRGMAQVQEQLREVSRQASAAGREAARGLEQATTQARKFHTQISATSVAMGTFASRAAATFIRELPAALADAAEGMRKLQETARTLGVSFQSLQNLNKAGSSLGIDPGQMNAELRELALKLSESAREGGKLAEFMRANGIAIKDANGAARPFKDVFADIARLISNAGSEVDKLNALKLLGLSEEMQRVFEQAGEDVRKFATDAGGEMDDFQKQTLARYQELKRDVSDAWKAISDGAVNYLSEVKHWALTVADAVQTAFAELLRKIEEVIARGRRLLGQAAEAAGFAGKAGTSDFEFRQEALQIGRRRVLDERAAEEREAALNKRTLGDITIGGGATGSIAFPVNAEAAHKAAHEAVKKHSEKVQELTEQQKLLNKAVKEFSDDLSNALVDIAINGKKAKDVFADLAKQLASAGLKSALSGGKDGGLLGGLIGAGASALGLMGGGKKYFSSPLFSGAPFKLPFMAEGGTLGAGKWGIAGEAGPELVHGPATVTPFSKMGGSNVSVNVYGAPPGTQTRETTDSRGGRRVDVMIAEGFESAANTPAGRRGIAAANGGFGRLRPT